MRWWSIVALLLASCGPKPEASHTHSDPRPTQPAAPPERPTPERVAALPPAPDPALAKRLDPVIEKAIAEQTIVGTVVMIARDGKLVYARAAGLADREAKRAVREDTLFRLASMTKPITVVTALALIDQGTLALADPVTKWLPDFKPKLADGRTPTITVHQLITHTSGLSYKFTEAPDSAYHKAEVSDGLAEPGLSAEVNLRRLASVPLLSEPGTTFKYSLSIDVLGEVIARAGAKPLPALVKEIVTQPLGMTDTSFVVTDRERLAWPYATRKPAPVRMTEPFDLQRRKGSVRFSPARIFDPASFPSGGAGLAGTARDYLLFLEALRTGGAPMLKPETTRAMTENQVGTIKIGDGETMGFGVGVVTDPVAAKSSWGRGSFSWGGIYGTGFWVDPSARMSVVILTNVAGGTPLEDDLATAIYAAP